MLFFIFFFLEIILLFFLSRLLTKSLSGVFLRITKSETVTIHLLSFLFLPGVIIHELSHLFVASVLFVKTGEIEFMPKIIEGGVKLGSVAIAKTDPVRRAIIGFAPVFVGLSAILGIIYFVVENSSLAYTMELNKLVAITVGLVLFYILFAISNTMFSSNKDLEGTLELLIVFTIVFIAVYIAGFRPQILLPSVFVDRAIEVVRNIDLFLLVPLAIDAGAVGAIRLLLTASKPKI